MRRGPETVASVDSMVEGVRQDAKSRRHEDGLTDGWLEDVVRRAYALGCKAGCAKARAKRADALRAAEERAERSTGC